VTYTYGVKTVNTLNVNFRGGDYMATTKRIDIALNDMELKLVKSYPKYHDITVNEALKQILYYELAEMLLIYPDGEYE